MQLGVDEEEVTPTSIIKDDLGAESIDFLDIMFRLEKAFGIKIPRGEMFDERVATDPNFVQNGAFTANGMAELKKRMPHSNFTDFEQDPKVDNMSKLFTVDMIVNYIAVRNWLAALRQRRVASGQGSVKLCLPSLNPESEP